MAASVTYTVWDGQIISENRGGSERDYVPDPLGNTIALIDAKDNITDTWTYWPYGEVQSHGGSSTTALTFLGTIGYFVDFLNELYVGARVFRADLTRWMAVDSSWPDNPGYSYVDGQPVGLVDPSGGQRQTPGFVGPSPVRPAPLPPIEESPPVPSYPFGPVGMCASVILIGIYFFENAKPVKPRTSGRYRPSPYELQWIRGRHRLGRRGCKKLQDECNMHAPPIRPIDFSCFQCFRICLDLGSWPVDKGCDFWNRKRAPGPV